MQLIIRPPPPSFKKAEERALKTLMGSYRARASEHLERERAYKASAALAARHLLAAAAGGGRMSEAAAAAAAEQAAIQQRAAAILRGGEEKGMARFSAQLQRCREALSAALAAATRPPFDLHSCDGRPSTACSDPLMPGLAPSCRPSGSCPCPRCGCGAHVPAQAQAADPGSVRRLGDFERPAASINIAAIRMRTSSFASSRK